ncbi:hypothetical protein [Pandoravirus japonicus]|uniref:Uncharacterized protein n=1 Tax=Pandoravirus japonicus TaxID=2823154 RepID=A0A811BQD0_9VIRU|nr:hypothetical protein [Pandoravirus japonicus]
MIPSPSPLPLFFFKNPARLPVFISFFRKNNGIVGRFRMLALKERDTGIDPRHARCLSVRLCAHLFLLSQFYARAALPRQARQNRRHVMGAVVRKAREFY